MVRVEMRPIAGGIVTSGILIPRNQVAINPDLAGYRVSRLYVDEGDWVKAGQPLAEMDSSILRAQLDQQLALAAEQKANAAEREKEAARVRGLDNQGVIAEEALQQRFYAATSAQAERHRADGVGEGDADPARPHGRARAGFRPGHPAQRQPRRHLRRRPPSPGS